MTAQTYARLYEALMPTVKDFYDSLPIPKDLRSIHDAVHTRIESTSGRPFKKYPLVSHHHGPRGLGATGPKLTSIWINPDLLDTSDSNLFQNHPEYIIREAIALSQLKHYNISTLVEEVITHESAHNLFYQTSFHQVCDMIIPAEERNRYTYIEQFGLRGDLDPRIKSIGEAFAYWLTDNVLQRKTFFFEQAEEYKSEGTDMPMRIRSFYDLFQRITTEKGIEATLTGLPLLVKNHLPADVKTPSIKPLLKKSVRCMLYGIV
ncbi:hypothetical protein HZB02_05805 [Candidatus Woesearchaeota archaeon]|nr:hypothetical protein [Candidatus Woesearchaeota archaeon]